MKNRKLLVVLGISTLLLGFILLILVISAIFQYTEKSSINYDEEYFTSRYITTTAPVLEVDTQLNEETESVIQDKQGILEVEETRKVIKVDENLSEEEKTLLEEKYSIEFTEDQNSNGIYVVNISEDSNIDSLQQELNAQIETDIPVKMFADNIDWGIARIGADKVWDIGNGVGVKVAIVDTGIQINHPDLVNNIVQGYDFVNNDSDANDDNGHGTHVAGITSASFNQAGVVGVSHTSKLIPVKVLNSQGYGYLSDVAKGVYYATDNGARVINLSLGSTTDSLVLKDAVNYASSKGVVVVAAAGNDGGAPCSYPAAYSNAICVVATDSKNLLASFSNIGGELAAPGVYNYSTYIGSTYKYLSGTSMATPHVAGAAALLFSVCPTCSASEIRTVLRETAVDLGEVGQDILFGYGLVDLTSAVLKLQTPIVEETPEIIPDETPTETPDPTPTNTPTNTPTKNKVTSSQVISIVEPVITKGKKYIPESVQDIDIKYTLNPISENSLLEKVVIYLDNKELESSTQQSATFTISQDLLNHSQHWVKVVASFSDNKESSAQIILDMTYLRTLEKTNTLKQKSVLGISTSIFDWLFNSR